MTSDIDLQQLAAMCAQDNPIATIRLALKQFDKIAIAFSGAEDVVLIDMAVKAGPDVDVFVLDTGRLHEETYHFIEQVREAYQVKIDILVPDTAAVEKMTREKGLFSFYKDGHEECCTIRKLLPLRRKLALLDAWITGQRKDQNPETRANIAVVEQDHHFSTHTLIKFNPLANWSAAQVWQYIQDNAVPVNELHKRGFISIGCAPCTRSVLPHQHEREGRWWWEEEVKKECGLHTGNTARDEEGP